MEEQVATNNLNMAPTSEATMERPNAEAVSTRKAT